MGILAISVGQVLVMAVGGGLIFAVVITAIMLVSLPTCFFDKEYFAITRRHCIVPRYRVKLEGKGWRWACDQHMSNTNVQRVR